MEADHQAEPCPWWLGSVLASPIRKMFDDPAGVVAPHVEEGMVVLEPGCGMGFFTLELARRVGSSGKVVAVDVQPRMLDGLRKRAGRAGLLDRLDIEAGRDQLGVPDLFSRVDFVLAFLVHELANPAGFFREVREALRPTGRLLIVEPRPHGDGRSRFRALLDMAARSGLIVIDRPSFNRNQVALLATTPTPSS